MIAGTQQSEREEKAYLELSEERTKIFLERMATFFPGPDKNTELPRQRLMDVTEEVDDKLTGNDHSLT